MLFFSYRWFGVLGALVLSCLFLLRFLVDCYFLFVLHYRFWWVGRLVLLIMLILGFWLCYFAVVVVGVVGLVACDFGVYASCVLILVACWFIA